MEANSSEVTFTVTTQELKIKAEQVSREISQMEFFYQALESLVSSTVSYWEGDAAELFRRMFTEHQNEVNDIVKRLKAHPTNLLTMAGIYEGAEQVITESNVKLPTNPLG